MALSGRERTIAIVTGIVLGAAAFYYFIVEPMLDDLQLADNRVNAAQQKLTDFDQSATRLASARKKWSQLAGASLLTDASAAQGQLLNRLTDYANAAGVGTGSLVPERSVKEQDFQRISFRATLTGNMDQLSRFLFRLKNADIPLRVNEVTITPRREGTDDLGMNILVSTIYIPPRTDGGTGTTATPSGAGGSNAPSAAGGRS